MEKFEEELRRLKGLELGAVLIDLDCNDEMNRSAAERAFSVAETVLNQIRKQVQSDERGVPSRRTSYAPSAPF